MNHFNITPSAKVLEGLGKPTRRGIKKCAKCGIYNGTRGSFCKNQQCGTSLKPPEDPTFDFDAVKLVTGTVRQIYSVPVKDHTPEGRGFVQLPVLHFCATEDVALCFVDSCQRAFNNSILKCHEEGSVDVEKCPHINLALKSEVKAKPLTFNKDSLDLLRIPYEIKEKLLLFAAESDSPLVQRVSKHVMAVKCQVTPKQPLGYLHFAFVKGRSKTYEKYYCMCTDYLVSSSGPCRKSAGIKYKCIHYYACIAALASERSNFDEFYSFISNELVQSDKNMWHSSPTAAKQIDLINLKKGNKINIISNNLVSKPAAVKKDSLSGRVVQKKKFVLRRCKKIVPKIYPIEIKILGDSCPSSGTPESGLSWDFLDWLAFVTESINKTMQFINCGIINSQVFYIPETFFERFKTRIPASYEGQATELGGVFYSIMNINHVKEMFDTPKVKLRIAKKFVHAEDKGYIEQDEASDDCATDQYQLSFIFFLNVGPSTVDESDNYNNSFIIEWLPNICATTKIGQFKLQYKYGRKGI